MAGWWNSTGASNFTRGLTSITGQLSTNLKDILTEAREENYDPTTELTRARQQIEDLQLRQQTLMEECTSLKKQCDEVTMQKQAVEIKSDMLLAESRRTIDEKDNELKRIRENTNNISWNNTNDNTWTDILEDDQPEINEYLRYQRIIRELKDENSHLRDEMTNLRKSIKTEKNQYRREEDIIQIEQMYSEQLSKTRHEYDEQIQKLQLRIKQLEDLNENHQGLQKEVDDVDKDLLAQELEQANQKLNWYNDKLKDYSDLQSQQQIFKTTIDQYEKNILQLQQQIDQFKLNENNQEQEQQIDNNNENELNRLLDEERQRCDALSADNDSMFQLLEQTRSQTLQNENSFKEEILNKEKQIDQLNSKINQFQDQNNQYEKEINQLISQINNFQDQKNQYEKQINRLNEEKNHSTSQIDNFQDQKNQYEKQIHQLNDEKNQLTSQIDNFQDQKNQYEKQVHELSEGKHHLTSQIDNFQDQKNQYEKEIHQLNEENNQLTSQIENFQDQKYQYEKEIDQLNEEKHQLTSQIDNFQDQKNRYEKEINLLNEEKNRSIAETNNNQNNDYEKEINQLNEEKKQLIFEINNLQQFKDEQLSKELEEEENRVKEFRVRELLEKQLIELNEDLQTLENDKKELNNQIDELKDQLQSKDRQVQNYENAIPIPSSPSIMSSSPNRRGRSPSPQTFERLLELEAQILRNEEQFRELNSVYERFVTLLPIELLSSDNNQLSLSDRFLNLFEQWSTYVDTLAITQQELESVKQLLIEKQDDLEKVQFDLDLTTTKLLELQQQQTSLNQINKSFHIDGEEEENEDEIEHILELHQFPQRAPSRQSLISSTPGEKQQLIAQNELLSSLLAEKDRELISLQQAEKTREDLIKNFDLLKKNLQQMELDKELKQVELNDIRNVLDEKLRETSSLKKEKMYFIEKLSEIERERQEQPSIIQLTHRQSSQEDDKSSTIVPTNINDEQQIHTKEQYEKLRLDYDQLVEFSKRQHDESLSYYNEYTRILSLYNELNTKSSQLQIDYESLQSLIQQKNEGYLQCQNELNNYQNLLYHEKKKSEDLDSLRSILIERDNKLQEFIDNETKLLIKQSELERDIKLLEQNNFELKSTEQVFLEKLHQTNTEHIDNQLINNEKKQLENELQLNKQKILQYEEREKKLLNEIERLRTHLLKMEETYTNDLIAAEDREKLLRNQIAQLDDTNHAQSELIQQLNTSGEQSKQALATELGTLKYEYTKLETLYNNVNNQLQYQMKCSQNLQNVLEQFKREREQNINEHLRQYQDALREQTSIANRLTNENNEIRNRLAEYNEALSAAHRLNDQIEKKDLLINTLRNDIHYKDKQIQQYEINLRDLQSTSGSRVEKQLVKNILLSYFHTPIDKRQEVIPLLGALVGFTQEEYKKAIDASSNNSNNPRGSGWLTGWLGGNQTPGGQHNLGRARTQSETPAYDPNKSFTELLIQYVDQQSANNPQHPTAKFNTDEYLHRYDSTVGGSNHLLRKPSLSASANPFVNTTHLTFNKQPSAVVLPTPNTTIMNPPPLPSSTTTTTSSSSSNPESSSTILKDLLKA